LASGFGGPPGEKPGGLCHDVLVNERPKATARPGKPNQPLPPCGRPTSGRVIRIHAGQSHGFIRDVESREVFFHRSDTTFGTFNKLIVGDKVAFELIEDRVSGPRATGVRLGSRERA
jgi:cold shock CspA family protein